MTGKYKQIKDKPKSFTSIIYKIETITIITIKSVAWSPHSSPKLNNSLQMINSESKQLNSSYKNSIIWVLSQQDKTFRLHKKYQYLPFVEGDWPYFYVL